MRSVVVGIGGVGRGRVGSVLSRVVSFVLLKLCLGPFSVGPLLSITLLSITLLSIL